ncbi:MAG: TonB-dependent receptor [Spirochaetaceae bacterium]|jgi:vitamin B12 transporter|nr:TonB-dependent receptor [Spirochaetaceae bacterium]
MGFRFYAKRIVLLPLLFAMLLFSLFSQEAQDQDDQQQEEENWEDFLFIEDEGITVTGTAETTQEIKVIDKEEIIRRNAPDLATLLQETLDLGFTRYGGYGNQADITLRGFDSERIAFLIDGVPVNSAQSGEFELSQIDLNAIERIEVIYGGSDTKYNVSGALGGVINIVTAKGQKPGLRLGGSLANAGFLPGYSWNFDQKKEKPHGEDLFDTQNLSLFGSYGAEMFSLKLNGFFNRVGNHFLFFDRITESTRRKVNNEIYDAGLSGSFIWNLPDSAKLIASASVYYGDKNIPTSGNSPIKGKQQDFSTRQNIMFDAPMAFIDTLSTEGSITHSWQTLRYKQSSESLHDEHSISAINRWTWYTNDAVTLGFGGDYRFITLDSTDMGDRSRHDGGVYITAEFQIIKKILIIPSVKLLFCNAGSQLITPVPKLGFAFKPLDFITIKNNYFRSFKYPDFEDLYWPSSGMGSSKTEGNPNLKPEDGWGGDVGFSYRFKELLTLESTFFIQWTVDSIHWSSGADGWKPVNVGEATFFGIDSKARFTIPVKLGPIEKISPGVSYQYMRSYLLSYGYTWQSEKRIPYMPEHTAGLSLDVSWGTGSVLLSGHYETLRYGDTSNTAKLDPHFLLTLAVNQEIGQNFNVFATFRNMTNTSYESFKDYPMPGFNFTLGVRAVFDVPAK